MPMNNIIILLLVIVVLSFLYDLIISLINFKHRKQPIDPVVKDVYDESNYKNWMDYSLEKYRVTILRKFIFVVINLLMILFNGFKLLEEISVKLSSNSHIQVVIFLALYSVVFLVISIISEYYDTFSIE